MSIYWFIFKLIWLWQLFLCRPAHRATSSTTWPNPRTFMEGWGRNKEVAEHLKLSLTGFFFCQSLFRIFYSNISKNLSCVCCVFSGCCHFPVRSSPVLALFKRTHGVTVSSYSGGPRPEQGCGWRRTEPGAGSWLYSTYSRWGHGKNTPRT